MSPSIERSRCDSLTANGYDYRYVFSKTSKHCESRVFEATLADTLIWQFMDLTPSERNP